MLLDKKKRLKKPRIAIREKDFQALIPPRGTGYKVHAGCRGLP